MQCIRAFVAQQPDELSLEKADVLLIHQQSSDGELNLITWTQEKKIPCHV